MKVAIKDANVLIDLETAGILDLWFQLGIETYVTNLVVGEIEKGTHQIVLDYIEIGSIKVEQCSGGFLTETLQLMEEIGSGPTMTDCSVLLLAKKLNAMLLSGDAPLRRAAEIRQVEVHGTIWIFDQLVEKELLIPKMAAQKLRSLLDCNRYLPLDACNSRINKWLKQ